MKSCFHSDFCHRLVRLSKMIGSICHWNFKKPHFKVCVCLFVLFKFSEPNSFVELLPKEKV